MANNPITGIAYFLSGINLITQKGIRHLVVIPFIINSLLFSILIYYLSQEYNVLIEYVRSLLPIWIFGWIDWLFLPIFIISTFIFVFFTFAIVANIISGPFYGLIAEAVEYKLTGKFPNNKQQSLLNIITGILPIIWDEILKILYYLLRLLPILILFFIPVINVLFPFIWFIFSAWMLAMGIMSIPMGNHELKFKQQHLMFKSKRLLMLGFGSISLGATLIPFVNIIAMSIAVAGATKIWVREFSKPN
jgi:CysZ protein